MAQIIQWQVRKISLYTVVPLLCLGTAQIPALGINFFSIYGWFFNSAVCTVNAQKEGEQLKSVLET